MVNRMRTSIVTSAAAGIAFTAVTFAIAMRLPAQPVQVPAAQSGRGPRELVEPATAGQKYADPPVSAKDEQTIIDHCLMIRHPNIVNDARATGVGAWSFGGLIKAIANQPATGIDPKKMVEDLLDQVAGDFKTVAEKAWDKNSGGKRTLETAPFRLLAIVNRIDLRNNLVLGGTGAGELRFVFGVCDEDGRPFDGTAILEYAVPGKSFAEIQAWGRLWYALRRHDITAEPFKVELQRITDQYARAGAAPQAKPNLSAISQIRASSGGRQKSWTFTESRLDLGKTGQLIATTTKQTPGQHLSGQPIINAYLQAAKADILADKHQVPPQFQGQEFLADRATIPNSRPPRFFFEGDNLPGTLLEPRHRFSLNTCTGCHAAETTTDFFHVTNRNPDGVARLSEFMTGINVSDPAKQKDEGNPKHVKVRYFNDLKRRAHDLYWLVEAGPPYEAQRKPLNAVH